MVLLDDVVEVFDLAHYNRHIPAGVDRIDGSLVGAALVHRDLFGIAIRAHGLVEKALRRGHVALCRQQKVDGLSLLVDSAVEVFPDALDLHVGLIHTPAATDRALVFAGNFLDERQKTDRPSNDRPTRRAPPSFLPGAGSSAGRPRTNGCRPGSHRSENASL